MLPVIAEQIGEVTKLIERSQERWSDDGRTRSHASARATPRAVRVHGHRRARRAATTLQNLI
jgi:hypothetical protein